MTPQRARVLKDKEAKKTEHIKAWASGKEHDSVCGNSLMWLVFGEAFEGMMGSYVRKGVCERWGAMGRF